MKAIALAATFTILCCIVFTTRALDIHAITKSAAFHRIHTNRIQTPLEDKQIQRTDAADPNSSANTGQEREEDHKLPDPTDCSVDADHVRDLVRRYDLQDRLEYVKRFVRFSRKPIRREALTKLDQIFLPEELNTTDVNEPSVAMCFPPLEVVVPESPFPSTVNASGLLFGVSTTFDRFSDSKTSPLKEWTYWLTDGSGGSNHGKLLLLLLDASDGEVSNVRNELMDAGIDAEVVHADSSMAMAVRYLSLVPSLYNQTSAKETRWLVLCDDDTFFPRMHGLIEKMASLDHTQPLYVGTLSEDANNIARHGSQAFGGAGVFLSLPMAAKITKVYDSCKSDNKIAESDSGWGAQGDILLRKCIYDNTDIRLTTLWDLWQMDITGDPAGFYESGIRPLSLHHYRGGMWHTAYPVEYTKLAHICGEDCVFQRFQTSDNFILSTFSIAHYPRGVDFNTNQMERTFAALPDDHGWNLDYMFGPQRPSLAGTGRKIAWELREATVNGDKSVTQVYVRKQNDARWMDGEDRITSLDGLVELVWFPAKNVI
jgi:hypothetical protein